MNPSGDPDEALSAAGDHSPSTRAEEQTVLHVETFDDEELWTDDERMDEVVQQPVSPTKALKADVKMASNVSLPDVAAVIRSGMSDLEHGAATGKDDRQAVPALSGHTPSSASATSIYYRCPACKGEHPLMTIQTASRASFEALEFQDNCEPCPKTGRQVMLSKSQLFWRDEADRKR
jgi:hypothetical protein